jgi:hypothetical protein
MLTQPQQASTAEPELGTAQPQLVLAFYWEVTTGVHLEKKICYINRGRYSSLASV